MDLEAEVEEDKEMVRLLGEMKTANEKAYNAKQAYTEAKDKAEEDETAAKENVDELKAKVTTADEKMAKAAIDFPKK